MLIKKAYDPAPLVLNKILNGLSIILEIKEVSPKAERSEVKKKNGKSDGATTIAQSLSPSKLLFTYLSGFTSVAIMHARTSDIITNLKIFFILNHIHVAGVIEINR